MELDRIDPELREARGKALDIPTYRWWGRTLIRVGVRFLREVDTPGVTRTVIREGGVRARVHVPEVTKTDAALLWIHGGGFILGAALMDDRFCGEIAAELGMTVIAPDYRLAPEHPFPAAHDDVHAAWNWVCRGELGVDPSRVIVGGGSAGGGLAAGLVLRLVDEGMPPAGQLLIAPMLDDRTALRYELDHYEHWIWSNRANRYGWSAYLGEAPGSSTVAPYAAPARRNDLSGLPPTWIGVGDVDLFHDEDVAYARRLEQAGVPTTLHLVPGAAHGFEGWAPTTSLARTFLAESRAWLATVVTKD